MRAGFREKCDLFIRRCQDAIAIKDIEESRKILVEATSVFAKIIPNWNGGLMSQFTGFYLDDVYMILGKLNIFKTKGYTARPQDYARESHTKKVIASDELIDLAIAHVYEDAKGGAYEIGPVIEKLRALQEILNEPMTYSERWILLKPILEWLATVDASLARHVLPLITRGIK